MPYLHGKKIEEYTLNHYINVITKNKTTGWNTQMKATEQFFHVEMFY